MDWQKLILELLGAGLTQQQIADAVSKGRHSRKHQAWISELSRGKHKDILWHDGERLRKLHARVMRRQKSSQPDKS